MNRAMAVTLAGSLAATSPGMLMPAAAGILGWAQLIEQPGLPDYEVAASESVVPGRSGETLVVFKNPGPLKFNLHPGASGSFDLQVAALAGGPYVPFAVQVNGVEVGRHGSLASTAHVAVASFTTPALWARDNVLECIPAERGPLGLLHVELRPAEFVSVAQSLWAKVVEPGSSAPVYRLHLYHPDILAAPHLRLTANAPCELRVDGSTLLASDGRTPVVQPMPPLSRIARIEVAPANDALNFRFELASTPLGGGRFLDQLPAFLVGSNHVVDWPRAEIGDERIRAVVTLPDPVKCYYRGPRFEAAGMVVSLQGGGHEFASGNFEEGARDPVANDHVSGAAEEFGDEAGFDEAQPGEPFLKVGVGLFEKPFAAKYSFAGRYWPLEIFPWEYSARENRMDFRQRVVTEQGWGYDYRKWIQLMPESSEMIIGHVLSNTGSRRLVTTHYNHHFFLVDRNPPGPAYTVEYGFEPVVLNPFVKPLLEVAGHRIRPQGDTKMCTGLGGCPDAASNWSRIHYRPSGTSITIRESDAPFRQALYVAPQGLCPESFVRIDLAPGEQKEWTRTYKLEPGP